MTWEYRILQNPDAQAFEKTLTELAEFEVIGFSSAPSKDRIMLSVLLRRPKPTSGREKTVGETVAQDGSWFPPGK